MERSHIGISSPLAKHAGRRPRRSASSARCSPCWSLLGGWLSSRDSEEGAFRVQQDGVLSRLVLESPWDPGNYHCNYSEVERLSLRHIWKRFVDPPELPTQPDFISTGGGSCPTMSMCFLIQSTTKQRKSPSCPCPCPLNDPFPSPQFSLPTQSITPVPIPFGRYAHSSWSSYYHHAHGEGGLPQPLTPKSSFWSRFH